MFIVSTQLIFSSFLFQNRKKKPIMSLNPVSCPHMTSSCRRGSFHTTRLQPKPKPKPNYCHIPHRKHMQTFTKNPKEIYEIMKLFKIYYFFCSRDLWFIFLDWSFFGPSVSTLIALKRYETKLGRFVISSLVYNIISLPSHFFQSHYSSATV